MNYPKDIDMLTQSEFAHDIIWKSSDGPPLPFRGGGKYMIRSAEELRRGAGALGPTMGDVAEIGRVRERVLAALSEVEERDEYLQSIKRQVEFMMFWDKLGSSYSDEHLDDLRASLDQVSLRGGRSRRASE